MITDGKLLSLTDGTVRRYSLTVVTVASGDHCHFIIKSNESKTQNKKQKALEAKSGAFFICPRAFLVTERCPSSQKLAHCCGRESQGRLKI
eukprot:752273-Hanusia_phi.AAC.6